MQHDRNSMQNHQDRENTLRQQWPEAWRDGDNPDDPSPWLALYLDQSVPLPEHVKRAWIKDSSSVCRQFVLPFARPLAKISIVLLQVLKTFTPKSWSAPVTLHRLLAWGLHHFATPEANWLILRHFHVGSQILAFIAANTPQPVTTNPLTPISINALKDNLFVQHDLNLYNFIIRLNKALHLSGEQLQYVPQPDNTMLHEPAVRLEDMPDKWTNVVDVQTAIELFTPVYQLFLTDNDFWRATNSLQLDETIALYAATILDAREYLVLLNNKHPLVQKITLDAGHRLVLHGLNSEMLHSILMNWEHVRRQRNSTPGKQQ